MTDSREALDGTLGALDIDPSVTERDDWKMVEEAPPDLRDMGDTYQRVNDHLASALKRSSFSVRHVTGEARALVDPAHRRILRRVHEQGKKSMVACYFEAPGTPTARDFVTQQHRYWGPVKWLDLIDLLELSASQTICISRLSEAEDVHFSVFGDSLVLLQEPHHHQTHKKWVWYIESPPFARALQERLEDLFSQTVPIDPESFDQLLDWLHEYETFEELAAIAEAKGVGSGEPEPTSIRAQLVALGFAEPGGAALTPLGREWFDRITGDARGN